MTNRWMITDVELRRIAMPLVSPFRTSFGSQTERDILLVRVELGDEASGATVDGWGECVALSEPSYSPEYVDGAQHVIIHHLLPRLVAAGPIEAADVAPALAKLHGHSLVPMMNGEVENIHDVMVASEKASVGLEMVVEVRNRSSQLVTHLASSFSITEETVGTRYSIQ